MNVVFAVILSSFMQFIEIQVMHLHMPRSFYPLHLMYLILFTSASRFCYRFIRIMVKKHHPDVSKHRMMIIGAGQAVTTIIKEIVNSAYLEGSVLCAIDDDKHKLGNYIQGVKVVGNRYHILEAVHKYKITDIIIAMPPAPKKATKEILDICKETDCNLKMLPGMYQLINEEVSISRLKSVDIEDLLGRDPIALNLDEIMGYVSGKVVMVTGGGGSIGSELCRQIVKY